MVTAKQQIADLQKQKDAAIRQRDSRRTQAAGIELKDQGSRDARRELLRGSNLDNLRATALQTAINKIRETGSPVGGVSGFVRGQVQNRETSLQFEGRAKGFRLDLEKEFGVEEGRKIFRLAKGGSASRMKAEALLNVPRQRTITNEPSQIMSFDEQAPNMSLAPPMPDQMGLEFGTIKEDKRRNFFGDVASFVTFTPRKIASFFLPSVGATPTIFTGSIGGGSPFIGGTVGSSVNIDLKPIRSGGGGGGSPSPRRSVSFSSPFVETPSLDIIPPSFTPPKTRTPRSRPIVRDVFSNGVSGKPLIDLSPIGFLPPRRRRPKPKRKLRRTPSLVSLPSQLGFGFTGSTFGQELTGLVPRGLAPPKRKKRKKGGKS